jgi:hypothetical protein
LSLATGAGYVTTAPLRLVAATVTFAGAVIVGACVSVETGLEATAEKVTAGSAVTFATRLFPPAVEPSVQLVRRAIPSGPVSKVAGDTAPPPDTTTNTTVTPDIAVLF